MKKPGLTIYLQVMERPPIEIPEPAISKNFCSASQSPRSILFQHGYPLSPTLSTDSSQQSIPVSPESLFSPPISPERSQSTQALNGYNCGLTNLRRCSSLQTLESPHLDSFPDVNRITTVGHPCSLCGQHPQSRSSGGYLRPCIMSPSKALFTATSHPSHDQSCDSCGFRSIGWHHLPSRCIEGHKTQVSVGRSMDDSLIRVPAIPRDWSSAPTTPRSGGVDTTDGGDLSGQIQFRQGEEVLVRCNDSKWLVGQVRRFSYNGLKVWIRSARTLVNIPQPLLLSHAAKLDGSLGHQASNYTSYTSFTSTPDELRALVHCVRPAHLAHRHLYQYASPSTQFQKVGGSQRDLPKSNLAARNIPVDSRMSHNPAELGCPRIYDPSICGPMVSVRGNPVQGSPQMQLISTSSLSNFDFYSTDKNYGEDKSPSYPISKDSYVDRPKKVFKPGLQGANMLISRVSRADNPCLNDFMTKADKEPQNLQKHGITADHDGFQTVGNIPHPHLLQQRIPQKNKVIHHHSFSNSAAFSKNVLPRQSNSVGTLPSAHMRSKGTEEVLHIRVDDFEPGWRGQAKVVKFSREYLSQHSVRHRHGHLLNAFAPGLNQVLWT